MKTEGPDFLITVGEFNLLPCNGSHVTFANGCHLMPQHGPQGEFNRIWKMNNYSATDSSYVEAGPPR